MENHDPAFLAKAEAYADRVMPAVEAVLRRAFETGVAHGRRDFERGLSERMVGILRGSGVLPPAGDVPRGEAPAAGLYPGSHTSLALAILREAGPRGMAYGKLFDAVIAAGGRPGNSARKNFGLAMALLVRRGMAERTPLGFVHRPPGTQGDPGPGHDGRR